MQCTVLGGSCLQNMMLLSAWCFCQHDASVSRMLLSAGCFCQQDASVSMMLLSVVGWNVCNRVYCIHVPGHDPLIFSFRSFSFFDWVRVLWPQLSKVLKLVRWAGSVPSPQCPCRDCLFAVAAGVHVFISGESLHCFLVGWCTNKSYVIGVQIKVTL